MHDVFISCSPADRPAALEIADRLKEVGLSVFIDQLALVAGDSFSDQIRRELRNARAVVVVLSSNSRRSLWVADELQAALDSKLVIPVLMDQGATENWLWPLLATRQGVVLDQNSPDRQAQLSELVNALAHALETEPTEMTPAAGGGAFAAAGRAGKPSMWINIAVALVSAAIGAVLTLLLSH
jgi:TIR domain